MPRTLCSYTESESNVTAHGQECLKELKAFGLLHSMNWCHVLAGKQVASKQCGCMFAEPMQYNYYVCA